MNLKDASRGSDNSKDEGIITLTNYLRAALRRARYEILPGDNSYYGEIPTFDGVYANAATLEACREELAEVLDEWISFRVAIGLPLPATVIRN